MRRNLALALLIATVFTPPLAAHDTPARPVIASPADLPQAIYPLAAPPSLAFASDAFMRDSLPKAKKVAADLLASADITDMGVRNQLKNGLAAIALLEGDGAAAERLILETRATNAKPQLKAIGNLGREAIAAGLQAPPDQRCAAAATRISERLAAHPAALIRDEALLRYSQVQTETLTYATAGVAAMLDAKAEKAGGLALGDILFLASARVASLGTDPCRDAMATAWSKWLSDPANAPTNIWPARWPSPEQFDAARPVVVGVWDTGIDLSLFPGQLAHDPSEPLDGKDNDGNGIIDDAYGKAWDDRAMPTAASLPLPSDFLRDRLLFHALLNKGSSDLRAGANNDAARLFVARTRQPDADAMTTDYDAGNEIFDRSHGTNVAGIVADGAPFIRLFNLRNPGNGYRPKRVGSDEAGFKRWLDTFPSMQAAIRRSNVRIVNLSWALTIDGIAADLMESGLETDPAKAMERASAMHASARPALESLIRDNPGILFVAGAGNANESEDSFGSLPQILDLPNLIVVGAVGTSGVPASFTTFGKQVRIYAQGQAVEVRSPGGSSERGEGTSFAAPFVTRAAAMMLAANPKLTPATLIDGLLTTATDGEGGTRLLHPAEAVGWARTHKEQRR